MLKYSVLCLPLPKKKRERGQQAQGREQFCSPASETGYSPGQRRGPESERARCKWLFPPSGFILIHRRSGGSAGGLALLLPTTTAAGGGPRASQERSLVAAFSRLRHKPQSSLDKQRLFSWPSLPFLAASALPVLASQSHSCRLCAQPRGNITQGPTET